MPEPITREEVYLNAIAQNTGGGDGGSVPEPITRTEQYLNQIVTNTAGGGGGGGPSLPAVTSDDNGDVLTVVEGQWAKAAPSGGVLVVHPDEQTMALDKTWQEIVDAGFSVLLFPAGDETYVLWLATYGVVYPSDVATWEVIYISPEFQVICNATSASGYPVMQMDNGGGE